MIDMLDEYAKVTADIDDLVEMLLIIKNNIESGKIFVSDKKITAKINNLLKKHTDGGGVMTHENKDIKQETVELKGSIKDKKIQEQFSNSLRRAMEKIGEKK